MEIIQTEQYQWNKNMVVEEPPDKVVFTAAAADPKKQI